MLRWETFSPSFPDHFDLVIFGMVSSKGWNLLYCLEPGPLLMSATKHGDKSSIISQKSSKSDIWDPKSIEGFGLEKLDVKTWEKGKDKVRFCSDNKFIWVRWWEDQRNSKAYGIGRGFVCFIYFCVYWTILFNNFSVEDMVNILGLAYNSDRSKETLEKDLLPFVTILQGQNLYGSGGCCPCCYVLVVYFLCVCVWELEWTFLCKNPKLPKAKNNPAHTH